MNPQEFVPGTRDYTLKRLNDQYPRIHNPASYDPPRITRESVSDDLFVREAVLASLAYIVEQRYEDEPIFTPLDAHLHHGHAVERACYWSSPTDRAKKGARDAFKRTGTFMSIDAKSGKRVITRIRIATLGDLIDEARTLTTPI